MLANTLRGVLFSALALGAILFAGCGGGGSGTGGSGGGSGGGGGTGGSAAAPSCDTYCADIQANCTGANQQYSTMENCMNTCKAIPVGAAADMGGNTLGCREYHAGAAKTDAATHCPHAGPGGDGVCGSTCDGYCQIAMMYCTDANMAKVYADAAACQTDCKAHKDDVKYNIAVDHGNEVSCLLYHAQEASTVPADHCLGDLDPMSTTCQGM